MDDAEKESNLELYVEKISDPRLQKATLESMRNDIREFTSSETSMIKLFKILCPHYETLQDFYEKMGPSDSKKVFADILSVLSWVKYPKGGLSLKYKILGTDLEIDFWGESYIRDLTTEMINEFKLRRKENVDLLVKIVNFYMNHNAEIEAVDLLLELNEDLLRLKEHMTYANYEKTCLYLIGLSNYTPGRDYNYIMESVFLLYLHVKDFCRALLIALHEDNLEFLDMVFRNLHDISKKQQLCYIIALHDRRIQVDEIMCPGHVEMLDGLQQIINNTNLSQGYLTLARELKVMEPKSSEDIYKPHVLGVTVESARQKLAATFVNAFVNAGFGQDKLINVLSEASSDSSSTSWLSENEEHGKASAAASVGMIMLWDVDLGLAQLEQYLHSTDTHVKAGALLGIGIVNCRVHNDSKPAKALLEEFVATEDSSIRIGAIMGLGLAYAGSCNKKVGGLLIALLKNPSTPVGVDVIAFAAISLGLIFVGSCSNYVAKVIRFALMDRRLSERKKPLSRFFSLGLGLLYLGKKKAVIGTQNFSETCNKNMIKYTEMTLMSCAYAGTGNVLKMQYLIQQCGDHVVMDGAYQESAVLGIAMVAMAEDVGLEMALRILEQLLQRGEQNIRKAVPLALSLLCISNPQKVDVVDKLSALSHEDNTEVAMTAIISLGLVGAGTNDYRITKLLRDLSSYYSTNDSLLFCVRIAQGLVHLGKGLLTLSPLHSGRFLLSKVSLAGLVTFLHACLDIKKIILGKYHSVLYYLVLAMKPRMLMTVDENLELLSVEVHVGQAVKASQAGRPDTITDFRTHSTPLILSAGQLAELATGKYIPLSPILEGLVILRENPEYKQD